MFKEMTQVALVGHLKGTDAIEEQHTVAIVPEMFPVPVGVLQEDKSDGDTECTPTNSD